MNERLDAAQERALERLLRARDLRTAARLEAVRGAETARLAATLLAGLDPQSPRAVEIEVDLLRRRADGLALARRWRRMTEWASYQAARARRDLAGGGG